MPGHVDLGSGFLRPSFRVQEYGFRLRDVAKHGDDSQRLEGIEGLQHARDCRIVLLAARIAD